MLILRPSWQGSTYCGVPALDAYHGRRCPVRTRSSMWYLLLEAFAYVWNSNVPWSKLAAAEARREECFGCSQGERSVVCYPYRSGLIGIDCLESILSSKHWTARKMLELLETAQCCGQNMLSYRELNWSCVWRFSREVRYGSIRPYLSVLGRSSRITASTRAAL